MNHRLGNRLFFIRCVEECRLEGGREESVNVRGTEGELSATDEKLARVRRPGRAVSVIVTPTA